MFRLWLRVWPRKTGAVVTVGLVVLAIVLATAWTAAVQRAYVAQVNDGTVPVNDTFTTTGLTKPSGTATTDPSGTDSTGSTGSTGLTFTVIPVDQPSLTIAKSHADTFTRGEDGVYTITVGNVTAAVLDQWHHGHRPRHPPHRSSGRQDHRQGMALHSGHPHLYPQRRLACRAQLPARHPEGRRLLRRPCTGHQHRHRHWRR